MNLLHFGNNFPSPLTVSYTALLVATPSGPMSEHVKGVKTTTAAGVNERQVCGPVVQSVFRTL